MHQRARIEWVWQGREFEATRIWTPPANGYRGIRPAPGYRIARSHGKKRPPVRFTVRGNDCRINYGEFRHVPGGVGKRFLLFASGIKIFVMGKIDRGQSRLQPRKGMMSVSGRWLSPNFELRSTPLNHVLKMKASRVVMWRRRLAGYEST